MGLDVYVRKCPNRSTVSQLEKEREQKEQELWDATGKKYDDLSESEKDAVRAKVDAYNQEHGFTGKYDRYASIGDLEQNSGLYPDHLFKIGYFRSSYNDGGFNSMMKRVGLPTLYGLFAVDNDAYETVPDWKATLQRVNDALIQFDQFIASPIGQFDAFAIRSAMSWTQSSVKDETQALAIFREQMESHANNEKGWRAYSNSKGEFYLYGIQCFGFIPGKQWNSDVVYAIIKRSDSEWYRHALEIVKETIEYVLAQPDAQDYYMVWSG